MMILILYISFSLIIIGAAVKFYNLGYNDCAAKYNELYDFSEEEPENGNE